MKSFKDNEGREWLVSINVDTVKRVKSLIDVDLLDIGDGKLFERLCDNPITLVDVLYCVCFPQVQQRQLTDVDFGKAMGGDAIDHATTALMESLIDFFPSRRRQVLQKALAKLKLMESKILDLAEKTIDDPKLDKKIEEALTKLGDSFIAVPQSLDATPDILPFATLNA